MTSQLQTLKAELTAGHPVTGAYSADNETAAAEINAENIATQRKLTAAELRTWGASGPLADITDASEDPASPVRAIALAAKALLTVNEGLDLSEHGAMVAALVSAGTITQAQSDALHAMADITISRADQLGLSRVRTGTVEQARALV